MADVIEIGTRSEKSPSGVPCLVVAIAGKLGPATVLTFEDRVSDLMKEGHLHLVLDCRGLEYMNSTGAGLLVKIMDLLEARGGSMQMIEVSKTIRDLMDVLGLLPLFRMQPSLAAALDSVR